LNMKDIEVKKSVCEEAAGRAETRFARAKQELYMERR
jgi:hypothetical protein